MTHGDASRVGVTDEELPRIPAAPVESIHDAVDRESATRVDWGGRALRALHVHGPAQAVPERCWARRIEIEGLRHALRKQATRETLLAEM